MRKSLLTALAAVAVGLLVTSAAPAQTVNVIPGTGQSYVQYYTPYTYGSNSYYYYPNTGYAYTYPHTGYMYSSNYVGPAVYGPGYTANYPWYYNQLNYGASYPYYNYYPGSTSYRMWRWR
ncbi:MAG TPA: hypothetical protein VGF55_21655 [Gemmataceae bacterium]|jgi:hypothetical protein